MRKVILTNVSNKGGINDPTGHGFLDYPGTLMPPTWQLCWSHPWCLDGEWWHGGNVLERILLSVLYIFPKCSSEFFNLQMYFSSQSTLPYLYYYRIPLLHCMGSYACIKAEWETFTNKLLDSEQSFYKFYTYTYGWIHNVCAWFTFIFVFICYIYWICTCICI